MKKPQSIYVFVLFTILAATGPGCSGGEGDRDAGGDDGGAPDDTYYEEDTGVDDETITDAIDDAGEPDEGVGPVCSEDHDDRTVGLITCQPDVFDGYTLFAPLMSTTTYLIDILGRIVNSWESLYFPGNVAYFLESGHLLRTGSAGPAANPVFRAGGIGGYIEQFDWDGNLVWEFEYSNDRHCLHHDIEMMPGGHILMISWERKTGPETVAAGRNPSLLADGELWPDCIIEVEPAGASGGNIVWEWHVWDHLIQDYDPTKADYGVVEDHPELVDVNFIAGPPSADWNHTNSVDYNPELDQIMLSVHNFHEIWIIDHSTTTEEAAGHTGGNSGMGGDLLYRWGNPRTYRAGDRDDRKLFGQHDAQWIEPGCPGEGNILVFNNGMGRPDVPYSSVEEIAPPVEEDGSYYHEPGSAFGPEEQAWIYTSEPRADFYSMNISGAQRLPNGNTLVCNGANGIFFEINPDEEIVWQYINPVTGIGPLRQGEPVPEGENGKENNAFRAYRYGPDYPGLDGKDLTPGGTIELPAE